MVKLILNGLQFNFSQSSNLELKNTEKNVSLSLPPPFSLLVLISLINVFLYYFYSHIKNLPKTCLIDMSVKRRVTEPINFLNKKLNCNKNRIARRMD